MKNVLQGYQKNPGIRNLNETTQPKNCKYPENLTDEYNLTVQDLNLRCYWRNIRA